MKKQLIRAAASAVLGLSLTTGFAAAQTGQITGPTGPQSNNNVHVSSRNSARIDNDNHLSVSNSNRQDAHTGSASVRDNTTGGDASSGAASNDNSASTSVSVDNGSGAAAWSNFFNGGDPSGSISGPTGPQSNNTVSVNSTNTLNVSNDNDIRVTNNNDQHASSGNANVSDNTTGGSASSGDASNSSNTSTTISVSN